MIARVEFCHSVTQWQVILMMDNTLGGSDCQKHSAFMKESEGVRAYVGTTASIFTDENFHYEQPRLFQHVFF
jgi:hypothetical protein